MCPWKDLDDTVSKMPSIYLSEVTIFDGCAPFFSETILSENHDRVCAVLFAILIR